MNEGLIPRRYAKALFKVAQDKRCADRIYALMTQLSDSIAAQPALNHTIANPFVPAKEKVNLINIAAGASQSPDPLLADFLTLLINNKRIDLIRDIALAYAEIYRKENKIYVVNVTSAEPLDNSELKRLRDIIDRHLPQGSSTEFTAAVNPALIGGFTIAINNERLDASIKNELKQLRLKLINS
ncbi:MAG: F0F1 ATP synthase subunit delta [Muribaculaceae bacterium]|nr:F0F1 ATP synthase subunit delta [Muribaculaceae bacterium]